MYLLRTAAISVGLLLSNGAWANDAGLELYPSDQIEGLWHQDSENNNLTDDNGTTVLRRGVITCYARNNRGVTFIARGRAENSNARHLQSRALQRCRHNSNYPRSCYAMGCRTDRL